MAATWLSLMAFSLGLLLAGSSKLPTGSPLAQDGPLGKDTGAHRTAETAVSASVAPEKWEWKAAGEGGHEQPLAPHQKEDKKVESKDSSVPVEGPLKKDVPVPKTTAGVPTSGLIQKGKMTKLLPVATLSPVPLGKVPQEAETTNSNEVLHVKMPKNGQTSPAPKSGRVGGKGLPVVTQRPSAAVLVATEKLNVSLAEAGTVSTATEDWPWLDDQTSVTSQTLPQGVDVSTAILRLKTTRSPTAEWPWLRDLSTASSQTSMVELLDVSTAALKGEMDTHQPLLRSKGNNGFSPNKVAATPKEVWSWLDEASTSSPPGDSDVSTVPGQTLVTEKTTSRGKGRANSHLGTATVRGPKTATPITTSPSAVSPRGNSSLLSQCLLAIALLGLVAAIFIVITAILATLLWRQKRAYKRDSQRPTEMVCISSLLATEEAEEARTRQARVKRVKMLSDTNGLETEMDNMTLNSFLPEH